MASSIPHTARPPALIALVSALASLTGCATGASGGGEADSAATKDGEDENAIPVEDEVPSVNKCHTDTQICELPEPLQPGLGCFCEDPNGVKEAGSAGG